MQETAWNEHRMKVTQRGEFDVWCVCEQESDQSQSSSHTPRVYSAVVYKRRGTSSASLASLRYREEKAFKLHF